MALQQPRTGTAALADFLLDQSADLLISPQETPWPWEGARWYELVYCLLHEAVLHEEGGSEEERERLRELVAHLAGLRLLEVGPLASAGGETAALLERLMVGYGLAPEAAAEAVAAIVDAAASVQGAFDGHIQRYLRLYGERMLAEVGTHFRFSALGDEAVGRVFTRWLQTAAAMPLSQMGAPVKALARAFESPPEAARAAADEVGLGLALLDDIAAASHVDEDATDA